MFAPRALVLVVHCSTKSRKVGHRVSTEEYEYAIVCAGAGSKNLSIRRCGQRAEKSMPWHSSEIISPRAVVTRASD